MANYWVFLNNEVTGPFGVEELIRLRGFSRQTRVCVNDASGKPMNWISPAEIPELAHIFRAADEHMASPSPAAAPKPAKAAAPRAAMKAAPAPLTRPAPRRASKAWLWWMAIALVLSGVIGWIFYARHASMDEERAMARALVENAPLPSASLYATLRQYLDMKKIQPRWEIERTPAALYHVTLSWYVADAAVVYAFETNVQAQTVRGLNTAAVKLLAEGFPAPASDKSKAAPAKKKSPAEMFSGSLEEYCQALEAGDFAAVWNFFSPRKRRDMAKGGMSQDGYIRLQKLTARVDAPIKQSVLKSKEESATERLVLLKQTQARRPDIFVKQLWLFEEGRWLLDDEEKRSGPSAPPTPEPASADALSAASASPSTSTVIPTRLPGMSN